MIERKRRSQNEFVKLSFGFSTENHQFYINFLFTLETLPFRTVGMFYLSGGLSYMGYYDFTEAVFFWFFSSDRIFMIFSIQFKYSSARSDLPPFPLEAKFFDILLDEIQYSIIFQVNLKLYFMKF